MKYRDKYKVFPIGWHNPGVKHRKLSIWMERSFVERHLKDLVDNQLHMSEQCAAASKKGSRMLGCINVGITSKDKEFIIPL